MGELLSSIPYHSSTASRAVKGSISIGISCNTSMRSSSIKSNVLSLIRAASDMTTIGRKGEAATNFDNNETILLSAVNKLLLTLSYAFEF